MNIPKAEVEDIDWVRVEDGIRSLAPYAQRCVIKTLLNGWATTTRTQLAAKAPCPLCDQRIGDSLEHFLCCDG